MGSSEQNKPSLGRIWPIYGKPIVSVFNRSPWALTFPLPVLSHGIYCIAGATFFPVAGQTVTMAGRVSAITDRPAKTRHHLSAPLRLYRWRSYGLRYVPNPLSFGVFP
jgi:hypothetical protein